MDAGEILVAALLFLIVAQFIYAMRLRARHGDELRQAETTIRLHEERLREAITAVPPAPSQHVGSTMGIGLNQGADKGWE